MFTDDRDLLARVLDLPRPDLAGRLRQHPAADRPDQVGLLGDRDELAGCHQPALGVRPADERLEVLGLATLQLHQRLVVQAELVALDGQAQLALQVQAPQRMQVHVRAEHGRAGLAPALRGVHGHVRVAQQLVHARVGLIAEADADAGRDEDVLAVDGERHGQRVADALGHVLGITGVLEQDGELVAAQPGRGVAGADAVAQPRGQLHQQLVARGVAEAVVQGLEVVQVQEQHRGGVVRSPPAVQGVLDAVAEEGAVGQIGQRVVEGLVGELVLEHLLLGHVAGVQHDAVHGRVAEQVGEGGLGVAPAGVLMAPAERGGRGHLGGGAARPRSAAPVPPRGRPRGSGR